MSWRNLILVVLLVFSLMGAYRHFALRPVEQPPGVLVAEEPDQREVGAAAPSKWGNFTVTPLASYRLHARLLSRESYSRGPEGKLAPLDFLVGWGPMSDNGVLKHMQFSQAARFAHWAFDGMPPIPPLLINNHASNNHLIPANDRVYKSLDKMRVGQVIELAGYLVEVSTPDGWHWRSSLVRTDTGAGACELIYVTRAEVKS